MAQTRLFDDHGVVEALFDALPDVVFFLKDVTGRYVVVNRTLADRCAGGDKARLLGRRPEDVFPTALAASYAKQDEAVVKTGRKVEGALELHLYPGGVTGWCLTTKLPLRDSEGRITGVAGISRDLNAPGEKANGYAELASVLERMRCHFDESLRIEELAALVGENAKRTAYLTRDCPALVDGKLVDRWGTPYWFHATSNRVTEIVSAGPDRKLFTGDDLHLP